MQLILKLCLGFCITFSVPVFACAKDWRGIIPLRSTRADVEVLLGKPPALLKEASRSSTLNKSRSLYFLDEGEVSFVFAEPEITSAVECLARIPAGTVLMIQVTPKKELSLGDFPIDGSTFRKVDPSQPPDVGLAVYINEQEGLIIRAFNRRVEQIVYIASAPYKGLCPSFYEHNETIMGVMVCGLGLAQQKFDEYGVLRWEDEKARLDNFAIQIKNQSGTVGYIIVYAGRRARAGEAHAHANRAKEYLEGHRKMAVGQVIAVDGGHREDFTIELFVGPADAAPPERTPTVQTREVQLIYDQEKPSKRPSLKP